MAHPLPNFDDLWNYNDAAGTAAKFNALLPQAETAQNPDYLAQLLTQIARTQSLQANFDEAHALLDRVEKMLSDDMPVATIRYELERGRSFNAAGAQEKAFACFMRAWELGLQTTGADFFAVDAAHMLANAAATPAETLEWNLKALELVEKTADDKVQGWRGSLYNNIGWTYHDQGDYEAALEIFERALAWQQEAQRGPENIRIARWCVARTYRSLGRVAAALALQQALLAEYEANGSSSGYVFAELGECLLLLDRADEARPYLQQAYDLLAADRWYQQHEPERLARLQRLAQGE